MIYALQILLTPLETHFQKQWFHAKLQGHEVFRSFFDPEVEHVADGIGSGGDLEEMPEGRDEWERASQFLEIGTEVKGQRFWNIYGVDLNGIYGGLNGIGGMAAVVRESNGQTAGSISDYMGNVVATVSGATLTWNPTKVTGYGPVPNTPVVKLETLAAVPTATSVAQSYAYITRRMDATGFIHKFRRYYEPQSGRFISPDPAGFGSDMSLYGFCNGDPINHVDPDGRMTKGATSGAIEGDFAEYDNDIQRWSGLVGQIGVGLTPVGVLGDVRDFAAAGNEYLHGNGSLTGVGLATVGLIPGASEIIKGGKAVSEISHAVKSATKEIRATEKEIAKEFKGGSYNKMTKPKGDGLDAHHMPADSSSPIPRKDGPAIQMEPADHVETSSFGKKGEQYREDLKQQWSSGDQGKRDAMAKEIKDVRRSSDKVSGDLTKYNQANRQMLDYAKENGHVPPKPLKDN